MKLQDGESKLLRAVVGLANTRDLDAADRDVVIDMLERYPFGDNNRRDKDMIARRYGFHATSLQPATLKTVGRLYGIGAERVRQIEAKVLCWLRRQSEIQALAKKYTDE